MYIIEKMFHQFHVAEAHHNYLRFLWWKQGDLKLQPSEFRMKMHLFGAASSPRCANFRLKHLAKVNTNVYSRGSRFIMRNFYVDDGLTCEKHCELCATGGLRLHKFVSNNRDILESVPSSERAIDVKDMNLTFSHLPLERALGIQWDVEFDHFRLNVRLKEQPATRRVILSLSAL